MKLPRVFSKYRVLLPLVAMFLILTVVFPRQAKFSYDYRKGSPWDHKTLIAQFDFPILKTDEQLREDKSNAQAFVVPYYRYRQDVVDNGAKALAEKNLGSLSSLMPVIESVMNDIWESGVVSDDGLRLDNRADPSNAIIYIQKDKRVSKRPAVDVLKESDAKAKMLALVSEKTHVNVDSLFRDSGINDLMVANLEYDPKTTQLVNAENEVQISTTAGFVSAGQQIVEEGEIVTSDIAQELDSYKVEFENNMGYGGPKLMFWFGNALLALVMTLLFVLVVYFLDKSIFRESKRLYYLIFVILLATLSALIVSKFAPRYLYLVPFTVTALYLESFFKNKIIMPICCVAFLPLLVFTSNGTVLFVMFIVASQVAAFSFKFFNQGWKQFITVGAVFVSLVVVYFAFRLVDMVNDDPYLAVAFLFVGSLLNLAGYAMVYLFERIFNLLSSSRLIELADTNSKVLRELEHKAPGTFQHSLQVMNMCDYAAHKIGADVALIRAGALYHDIGKMSNPLCFIENENQSIPGKKYHDSLTAKESAAAIIKHVSDGLEIAEREKLPKEIRDFIITHHGTSNTAYFYNKYLNEGGDPRSVSEFFYKGRKPQTKEQGILMICDTLEAASRTIKDTSPESFSNFVDSIFDSKIKMGQLDECDLTLRELTVLKTAMKAYLSQIYHERVVYPTRK